MKPELTSEEQGQLDAWARKALEEATKAYQAKWTPEANLDENLLAPAAALLLRTEGGLQASLIPDAIVDMAFERPGGKEALVKTIHDFLKHRDNVVGAMVVTEAWMAKLELGEEPEGRVKDRPDRQDAITVHLHVADGDKLTTRVYMQAMADGEPDGEPMYPDHLTSLSGRMTMQDQEPSQETIQ